MEANKVAAEVGKALKVLEVRRRHEPWRAMSGGATITNVTFEMVLDGVHDLIQSVIQLSRRNAQATIDHGGIDVPESLSAFMDRLADATDTHGAQAL